MNEGALDVKSNDLTKEESWYVQDKVRSEANRLWWSRRHKLNRDDSRNRVNEVMHIKRSNLLCYTVVKKW